MTAHPACRVRRARPTDLEAVLGVIAEGKAVPPSAPEQPPRVTDLERDTWVRMTRTPDLSVYLADVDGTAVGTAAMLLMPHLTYGCHPTAFIEAVAVKYAHRRRGIARQLLTQALDDAREAGCLKVQLLSHKRHADDGAHRLYQNAGFTAEAEGFRLYLKPWRVPN